MSKRYIYTFILKQKNIPDDIICLIENHLLKGLKIFQRKIKKYLYEKKSGYEYKYCHDCHKKCKPGESLTITNACSDANGNCCHKYVCSSGLCGFHCPNGHINYTYQYDYYTNLIQCLQCKINYKPEFIWYGLSPIEYDRRFN